MRDRGEICWKGGGLDSQDKRTVTLTFSHYFFVELTNSLEMKKPLDLLLIICYLIIHAEKSVSLLISVDV